MQARFMAYVLSRLLMMVSNCTKFETKRLNSVGEKKDINAKLNQAFLSKKGHIFV